MRVPETSFRPSDTIYLSIYRSIYRPTPSPPPPPHPLTSTSAHQLPASAANSTCQLLASACQILSMYLYLSVYLSIHLSFFLPPSPRVRPSPTSARQLPRACQLPARPRQILSIYTVYLSIYLSISLSLYLSLSLSLCLSSIYPHPGPLPPPWVRPAARQLPASAHQLATSARSARQQPPPVSYPPPPVSNLRPSASPRPSATSVPRQQPPVYGQILSTIYLPPPPPPRVGSGRPCRPSATPRQQPPPVHAWRVSYPPQGDRGDPAYAVAESDLGLSTLPVPHAAHSLRVRLPLPLLANIMHQEPAKLFLRCLWCCPNFSRLVRCFRNKS